MKRIILTILVLFLALPVFAGNLLQQEYETQFVQNIIKNGDIIPSDKVYLIKEDYYVYKNRGDSTYGLILNLIEKYQTANIPNKDLNIRYLKLLKSKIDNIVAIKDTSLDGGKTLKASLSKIIIDDEDYRRLEKEIREGITATNILFFE